MSDRIYNELPGMRFSTLKAGAVSARHLKHAIEHPFAGNAATEWGNKIHKRVLEPVAFSAEAVDVPDAFVSKATGKMLDNQKVKDWRVGYDAEALLVTAPERESLDTIHANIMEHEDARCWIESADRIEAFGQWTETVQTAGTEIDIQCKWKADAICTRLRLLWDLKSIGTSQTPISEAMCVKAIANRLYHSQLSWYSKGLIREGVDISAHGFVFVESQAPFDVVVIQADADMMAKGYELAERLLARYATGLVTGRWPGVAEKLVIGKLPKWPGVEVGESSDELSAWGI